MVLVERVTVDVAGQGFWQPMPKREKSPGRLCQRDAIFDDTTSDEKERGPGGCPPDGKGASKPRSLAPALRLLSLAKMGRLLSYREIPRLLVV
jgi:hypothetical protein